jgi:hypothetical protein
LARRGTIAATASAAAAAISETPATGFEVNAAAGVVLASCYVRAETSIAFHVTRSARGAVLISPREASPDNATASIQVDPASTLTVITPNLTTAASYATGTTNVIGDANDNIGIAQPNGLPGISIDAGSGSSSSLLRLRRGSNASFTAGMLVSTSGTDKWLVGMRNDSTNNLHIRDVANGLSALCTVPNATQPSLSLLSGTPSLGSGVGVIFIANNSSDPSGTPLRRRHPVRVQRRAEVQGLVWHGDHARERVVTSAAQTITLVFVGRRRLVWPESPN